MGILPYFYSEPTTSQHLQPTHHSICVRLIHPLVLAAANSSWWCLGLAASSTHKIDWFIVSIFFWHHILVCNFQCLARGEGKSVHSASNRLSMGLRRGHLTSTPCFFFIQTSWKKLHFAALLDLSCLHQDKRFGFLYLLKSRTTSLFMDSEYREILFSIGRVFILGQMNSFPLAA